MKLEKWALIAEMVSAVAIVVTLAILIIEIRGNTDAIRIANRQAIATRVQELSLTLAENEQLGAMVASDLPIGDEDPEIRQLWFFVFANLRTAEEAYLLYREGHLDEEYWQTRGEIAVGNLSHPAIRSAFRLAVERELFTSEFAGWLSAAATNRYGE